MTQVIFFDTINNLVCGQIYKYIGLENGLSSRNVHAVQQSNGGFMWFLTDNGIDRYDGSEMGTYTLKFDDVKFTEYSSCRFIYDQLDLNYADRSIKCEHFMRSDALRAFRKWDQKEDKVEY